MAADVATGSAAVSRPERPDIAGEDAAASAALKKAADPVLMEAAKKTGHDILKSIADLRRQQQDLRAMKKQVAKKLKNEEKRRSRLRKKARALTDSDLVALLKMRGDQQTEEAAKGGSSSSSK